MLLVINFRRNSNVPNLASLPTTVMPATMTRVDDLDHGLYAHFQSRFIVQPILSRSLVSFQANKVRPAYRWYKYKEAFSASLVEYLFEKYPLTAGRILDPFAGSGTALFAASAMGLDADGIELLPIGQQIIATKQMLDSEFTPGDFDRLKTWSSDRTWETSEVHVSLPELRITQGAYPANTRCAIEQYLGACQKEAPRVQAVLRFALLCVLESISYTRKDGQYLRWDFRSGRTHGNIPFDKGPILDFAEAICDKIDEITADLRPMTRQSSLFTSDDQPGMIRLYDGSCLELMPTLPAATYDGIMTSPPYCNRYDYTRTYALELALLGTDERGISALRQAMLSCTVENRSKDLLQINSDWHKAVAAADNQPLLQSILEYLADQKSQGLLNNNGILRMVRGYFYEMACVIQECARLLKPRAPLFMVNDNVRYAGARVSVDMILSDFAEKLGFEVENILVLPGVKGNSSQQMGEHGREPLRKCVYVWRKL